MRFVEFAVLAGGVGGARFLRGLRAAAPDAGITAIVQPGGSVRDPEVIEAANERGIAMVFTGRRLFRH